MTYKKGIERRAIEWLMSDNTGNSSKRILAHMMSVDCKFYRAPSYAGAFGRCVALIELIPEWERRLKEMGRYGHDWEEIIDEWPRIKQIMQKESGGKWTVDGAYPETEHAIKMAIFRSKKQQERDKICKRAHAR